MAIHTGSITSPTKKSATENEAKNRLETVRRESFLQNNYNTTAFPVTAGILHKESHSDRTMDAALLRCSSGWPSSMVRWCTATAEDRK